MEKVYIALGSNVGDRFGNIRTALDLFEKSSAGRVLRVSELIETESVGGPAGQRSFINGAAEIETGLEPEVLLDALKSVEADLGRVPRERWGPREIDLDILLYGSRVLRTPRLVVPHPRMLERVFVLRPLAEIAPGTVHPVAGVTIAKALATLESKETLS